MGTNIRFAVWYKRGRIFIVRPPGWPKNVDLSFTDQGDMMEWAKAEHVMLKDGNVRRERNDRFAARNFGEHSAACRPDGVHRHARHDGNAEGAI